MEMKFPGPFDKRDTDGSFQSAAVSEVGTADGRIKLGLPMAWTPCDRGLDYHEGIIVQHPETGEKVTKGEIESVHEDMLPEILVCREDLALDAPAQEGSPITALTPALEIRLDGRDIKGSDLYESDTRDWNNSTRCGRTRSPYYRATA